MPWFGWLLGVVIVIAWVAAIVDIVRRRRARTVASTSAWVLIVLILPIAGTIAYFLVNADYGDGAGAGATQDPSATRFGR